MNRGKRGRKMKHFTATVLLAALCLLLVPSLCQAAYDPIGGGTTKLSFDASFLSLMRREGIKLSATAPAKLKGQTLILPVEGGKEDPTTGKGEVEHEGSLVFAEGKRKVPLRSIELKAKKTPLFAKVGGSQL